MPQLAPLPLANPGALGLNTEEALAVIDPRYATRAMNAVISSDGRLSARLGWNNQTTGEISGSHQIDVLHEYVNSDGAVTMIVAANNKIYKDIDDFTDAANDITPSTAPTGDNWNFQNFNGKVLGFQDGHTPIVWSGSGDFADITANSGSLPTGGAAVAAFGRVWCVDSDAQTIQYSALLDETRWAAGDGGGSIDMTNVWTDGVDTVQAIAAFGATLVVFGKRHIIMWTDGAGSDIGIDPTQIYVVDTIEGTGCIARDSVQKIGEGDMMFLSPHGLQLLNRVQQDRVNPMKTVTKKVKNRLDSYVSEQSDLTAVRSVHSPEYGFYLLCLPDPGKIMVVDTRRFYQDDTGQLLARITEWEIGPTAPAAVCARLNGNLLFGFTGEVGLYFGRTDNNSSFTFSYYSGWLDLGDSLEARLKILKEIRAIINVSAATQLVFCWAFDFNAIEHCRTVTVPTAGASYYSEAEYSIDEWGGLSALRRVIAEGAGEGQYIQFSITIQVDGSFFEMQQATLLPKIGRLA